MVSDAINVKRIFSFLARFLNFLPLFSIIQITFGFSMHLNIRIEIGFSLFESNRHQNRFSNGMNVKQFKRLEFMIQDQVDLNYYFYPEFQHLLESLARVSAYSNKNKHID